MKRVVPEFRNAVFILLGILSASMGLKGFLLSSHFIDGGVTGISMLLAKTTRGRLAAARAASKMLRPPSRFTRSASSKRSSHSPLTIDAR